MLTNIYIDINIISNLCNKRRKRFPVPSEYHRLSLILSEYYKERIYKRTLFMFMPLMLCLGLLVTLASKVPNIIAYNVVKYSSRYSLSVLFNLYIYNQITYLCMYNTYIKNYADRGAIV